MPACILPLKKRGLSMQCTRKYHCNKFPITKLRLCFSPFYRDFFCKKNWQSKNYNYTVKTLMIYVLLSNLTGISLVTNITLVSDSIHYEWARERISGYHHHIFIDVFFILSMNTFKILSNKERIFLYENNKIIWQA